MVLELKKTMPRDTRVLIVSLEQTQSDTVEQWQRLPAIAADIICMNKQPGIDLGLVKRLARVFKEHQASAIHTHHIGPLIYGGLAAKLAGIKNLVHTEHDAWHLKNKKRRFVQRAVLALTKPTLVADSILVAKGMKDHLLDCDVSVIRNGIDVQYFHPGDQSLARQTLSLNNNVMWIGSSGRLEPVKGHEVLIKAMRLLPDNIHLAIAGKGSQLKELRAQALAMRIDHRIHFLGHQDDMRTFYQALDLFCLPSLQEGMPLAPLEAQSCGIPVVMSDTGGTREAICEKTGRLVEPGNSVKLAETLMSTLRKRLKDDPREFVENTANLRDMTEAYRKCYKLDGGVNLC